MLATVQINVFLVASHTQSYIVSPWWCSCNYLEITLTDVSTHTFQCKENLEATVFVWRRHPYAEVHLLFFLVTFIAGTVPKKV